MKRDSDWKVLCKLYALFARNNKATLLACVSNAIVEGTKIYIPIILSGILIDELSAGAGFRELLPLLGTGLLIMVLFQVVNAWLRKQLNSRIENCMERQNYDMNIQSVSIDYGNLENPQLQEKKRKQEQVISVRGGIYWMLIWPIDRGLIGLVNVVTALAVAVPMFLRAEGETWYSTALGILLMLVLAGNVLFSYQLNVRNNFKSQEEFEKYAKCNRVGRFLLQNILAGTESGKDLRIFCQGEMIKRAVDEGEQRGLQHLKRERVLHMRVRATELVPSSVSTACIYLYAAWKAVLGIISIGSVVRYAASIVKCVSGLSEVFFGLSGLQMAALHGRDYLDYIQFENSQYKGSIPVEKRRDNRFLLEFDHVSFCYPGSDDYVIKDLTVKLDIGEKVAIVGRNGSGKSTFIKLLCRLYDVTEGTIRLNGIDIRKYDYEEYLKLFSVVFQDFRIFSLKVGENIAAGALVDQGRAEDALRRAGLEERYHRMSEGLDTFVGREYEENGENFSGGERQKLAIARAIYRGAPFVIMDEPTAALDPVSECEVFEGFDKMVGTRTAIYISHRLASCRFCNDILVFDKGQIVQRGSHEELAGQDGLYRQLWEAQAGYYA